MSVKRLGLLHEALTHSIIGAFFEVYNILGFGFLESVYKAALERELRRRGHRVEREVLVKIWYKGDVVAYQRIDMLVDGNVIVEVKAGAVLPSTGSRQLHNYLKAADLEVGLLLHFGPEPKYVREFSSKSRTNRPSDGSAVSDPIRDQPAPLTPPENHRPQRSTLKR